MRPEVEGEYFPQRYSSGILVSQNTISNVVRAVEHLPVIRDYHLHKFGKRLIQLGHSLITPRVEISVTHIFQGFDLHDVSFGQVLICNSIARTSDLAL